MSRFLSSHRLPSGGLVDRTRRLAFSFDGRTLYGHRGDTLAAALLANGVRIVGRSFKYHRPRGLYAAGHEDPNAMLAVRDAYGFDPAIRAGQVRLADGMDVRSTRGWPTARFDLGAGAQLAAGLLGAGFYYKTFMWPGWMLFEPFVRRVTGIGRAVPRATDTRQVEHRHATCDVLIVGAGPAGLLAARHLSQAGLRMVIADDGSRPGGSLLWEEAELDGIEGVTWSGMVEDRLAASPNVTLLTAALVTGAYEGNVFTLVQSLTDDGGVYGERHWTLRARHVVLATGAVERPPVFAGNDRPGIMLGSFARRLVKEFGVAPPAPLAIYTNNDSGYLTALAAHRAGVEVTAVIDNRPATAAVHAGAIGDLGIACLSDSVITGTRGYRGLSAVIVTAQSGGRRTTVRCAALAVSGGWTPLVHLAAQRGSKVVFDPVRNLQSCAEPPENWWIVGGAAGCLDLSETLAQAARASAAIALVHGHSATQTETPRVELLSYGSMADFRLPPTAKPKKTWIDFQNDVTVSDIALAVREGYVSVEHLKRYTTLGMGTDQGRTSNANGIALLAELTGRDTAAVGTTTFRPPFVGVRMATLAGPRRGDLHRPRRYLPAHESHAERQAVFEDFGWERPDWYRSNSEYREEAVAREMAAIRTTAGVFDSSPLGKIEVAGPDAAEFISRFYVSNMATLKVGRLRYSVMLRDDGVIFDDGVVARLDEYCFLASPTSANADKVAAWFERWHQTEWPSLDVAILPVTANWAAYAVGGPAARQLLERLQPSFDVSPDAFPHMHFREGVVAGITARVASVSFTGERQYEITVPARQGRALFDTLLDKGKDLQVRPVGMEAWLRLRIEKGYLHIGAETNGRTTALDVGIGEIVAKRTGDFIGKRALTLPFATSKEREQLIGVTALDGTLEPGGRILAPGHVSIPCQTEGYVTSACFSPGLGKSIGLALLERGFDRLDEVVSVYQSGRIVRCRICKPVFYDPDNERLRA